VSDFIVFRLFNFVVYNHFDRFLLGEVSCLYVCNYVKFDYNEKM
jgi:hypothetical protein